MEQHTAELLARNLSAAEIDALEDRIYGFNSRQTGFDDAESLEFEIVVGNESAGFIAGFTWARFCEIRQLWVDERFRMTGYGAALLSRAVEEARRRGCSDIYVATYSFQAPEFYKRFGFQTLAVIADKPPGHSDIILRLVLEP